MPSPTRWPRPSSAVMTSSTPTPAADEHVRRLPKMELHVHVEGAAPPSTIAELASRNGVDLGVDDPADLYRYEDLTDFLRVFDLVCQSQQHADDIHRVAYEALEIAAAAGVRHREMFFSPTFLMRHGVPFDTIWQGLESAVADAALDFGISCSMILDVDKPSGAGAARELIERAAGYDRELLVGIGGDAGERDVDLAAFVEPFDEARRLGFRTTMHLGEEGPVSDIAFGVDEIGVERVDHGFSVLDDPALTERLAARRLPFTVCPTSNRMIGLVAEIADHPVLRMRDAGLLVSLNSDNAAMFGIDLADEYCNVRDAFGLGLDELESFSLASIESSWLPDDIKRQTRQLFVDEMNALRAERGLPPRDAA